MLRHNKGEWKKQFFYSEFDYEPSSMICCVGCSGIFRASQMSAFREQRPQTFVIALCDACEQVSKHP